MILHFYQQYTGVSTSLHPCWDLLFSVCFISHFNEWEEASHWVSNLCFSNCYWYFEHLFMFLLGLAICVSFLEKCVCALRSFFNQVVVFVLNYRNSLYIMNIKSFSDTWYINIFSIPRIAFHSTDSILWFAYFYLNA